MEASATGCWSTRTSWSSGSRSRIRKTPGSSSTAFTLLPLSLAFFSIRSSSFDAVFGVGGLSFLTRPFAGDDGHKGVCQGGVEGSLGSIRVVAIELDRAHGKRPCSPMIHVHILPFEGRRDHETEDGGNRVRPGLQAVQTPGMNERTPHLPWPTPDLRSPIWGRSYADMHGIVEQLVIPEGLPQQAVSVITTARELIRHSYFRYKFSTVAVAVSIIAVEAALADRYGNKKLNVMIDRSAADGLVTEEQRDMLHTGREIRNRFAHGKITHSALSPAMAVTMVQTSLSLLELLIQAVPATQDPGAGTGPP